MKKLCTLEGDFYFCVPWTHSTIMYAENVPNVLVRVEALKTPLYGSAYLDHMSLHFNNALSSS